MDLRIIYSILLSFAPIAELRIGLPLAMSFALANKIPFLIVFILCVSANILAIFLAFYLLDSVHIQLMRWKSYQRFFKRVLSKFQKKVDKLEKRYNSIGFLALILFVAVPLPGTGAWTAAFISWILGLDRKESVASIALGVVLAGIIVSLGSFVFIR